MKSAYQIGEYLSLEYQRKSSEDRTLATLALGIHV